MFKCFVENKLISFSQSGFKPVDYCFNQLLSITHEIYSSVDKVIRIFFLDILKAFDKVCTKFLNFYTNSFVWLYFV